MTAKVVKLGRPKNLGTEMWSRIGMAAPPTDEQTDWYFYSAWAPLFVENGEEPERLWYPEWVDNVFYAVPGSRITTNAVDTIRAAIEAGEVDDSWVWEDDPTTMKRKVIRVIARHSLSRQEAIKGINVSMTEVIRLLRSLV